MQVVIARLQDLGWNLTKFEVSTYEGSLKSVEPKFNFIEYKFTKPDQKLELERKFNLKDFQTSFSNLTGMNVL